MSTDRHPLHDALAEAERLGGTYEVPVERVRDGVRRRRRVRAGVRGGAAAAVVALVAVGVQTALGGGSGVSTPALGDRPVSSGRCGQVVRAADAESTAPGDTALDATLELRDTIGADRVALTTGWLRYAPAEVTVLEVFPPEVVLLRDGIVVAVENGTGSTLASASEPSGVPGESHVEVASFTSVLVSCAPYPDGAARVPPGVYELMANQTVNWRAPDGRVRSTHVVQRARVTVTEYGPATDEQRPEECGTDTASLAAAAGPEASPFPLTLDAAVPAEVPAGGELRFTVSATNTGKSAVHAYVGRPGVLIAQNGKVVATPPLRSPLMLTPPVAPGGSTELDAVGALVDCTSLELADSLGPGDGHPLAPGRYEVWVSLDVMPTGSSGPAPGEPTDAHLVHGPWPLTLR